MSSKPATILHACLRLANATLSRTAKALPPPRYAARIRRARARPCPDAATREALLVFEMVAQGAFIYSQLWKFTTPAVLASARAGRPGTPPPLDAPGVYPGLAAWLRTAGLDVADTDSSAGLFRLPESAAGPPPEVRGQALAALLAAGEVAGHPQAQANLCTVALAGVQGSEVLPAFAAIAAVPALAPIAAASLFGHVDDPLLSSGRQHGPNELAWLIAALRLRLPAFAHARIAASNAWANERALQELPPAMRQSLLAWNAAGTEAFLAAMPAAAKAAAAFNARRDIRDLEWTQVKFLASDSDAWQRQASALAEASRARHRMAVSEETGTRRRRMA